MSHSIFLIEDLSQQHLPARSAAAVLKEAGFDTHLIDYDANNAESIISLAVREQPRLIIASVLFADRIAEYLDLFTTLRQAKLNAHHTIIGPLPAFTYAELLNACPALDSVLCNEPETTITQLANTCDDKTQWQNIPGIAHRSPTPHVNPTLAQAHLDDLPFPISSPQSPSSNLRFATIAASRGCYHECSFCLPCAFYRGQGTRYRLKSISQVTDEIEFLARNGTQLFLFDDEQFLPPQGAREKRIAEFDTELRRRNLHIAFTLKCRADDVEPNLFRQLQNLGLLRAYIGIESGHAPTLEWMNKKTSVAQNIAALETLAQLGIVANFRMLMFHPWSTLETIRAEIDFLQNVLTHTPTLFSFREIEVYPGTPLAKQISNPVSRRNWVAEYIIADPRAELLRRLDRIVFASSCNFQDTIDQAWFEVLIQRRFQPHPSDAQKIQHLESIVAETNRFLLDVWQEMIAFVENENIYDAELVNKFAADWTKKTREVLETLRV